MHPSESLDQIDFLRLDASRKLDHERRAEFGQFLTPMPIAKLMASMFQNVPDCVRILDPGAGVGTLFCAVVVELCNRKKPPKSIHVTAYEIDQKLGQYVPDSFRLSESVCQKRGVVFVGELIQTDFLTATVEKVRADLFKSSETRESFHYAILNPPYRKISRASATCQVLRQLGVETTNLYTGFLAAAIRLLASDGELVAITPRSFCSGSYFNRFRQVFLREMALRRLHVFESRRQAFREDDVLQENIIVHAVKGGKHTDKVLVTSSAGPDDEMPLVRELDYAQVVRPGDSQHFIHIAADDLEQRVADQMDSFQCSLADLGLTVSTGRVVDFRAEQYLRSQPGRDTVPLVWPTHFDHGFIAWPKAQSKKPNAIVASADTRGLLVPNETYVLVRRFSAKEERRRVVAAVSDPGRLPAKEVGFENHLNYYHYNGGGLEPSLAKGLAAFLNSTLVDAYFRQFNGHTQVNATDLRSLRYPSIEQLQTVGRQIGDSFPPQAELDALIAKELLNSPDPSKVDPVRAKQRIQEALQILQFLGFPRQQRNERSALTLLALLDLKPETPWVEASNPLRGITPMMDFFRDHYGKNYAPNTRETVRRQTVHQFLDAGLVIANPDDPRRAINSAKNVYQVEASALELLRTHGTDGWDKSLRAYLSSVETLQRRYAQERRMSRIPVTLAPGQPPITLSPGGQNVLVKQIIEEFAPRFTPGGTMIYVGDTDEKFAYFDKDALHALGVDIEAHGKMPDVLLHHVSKNWLVLVEAVTSHGPINPKRHRELNRLFQGCQAGLVFVTAFLDRKTMVQYLGDISWETEVWVADSPSHMIHFNGERFLGPYPGSAA